MTEEQLRKVGGIIREADEDGEGGIQVIVLPRIKLSPDEEEEFDRLGEYIRQLNAG